LVHRREPQSFEGGTYQGDLDFSGSRVTLFGEGILGGNVILQGNITVTGSDSRISRDHDRRIAHHPCEQGRTELPRVDGALSSNGSDGMLLANALCGSETIPGSGTIVLGNDDAAPSTTCP
jgi:hypothetical protein